MKIQTFQKWKAAFTGYATTYDKPSGVPITNCEELNITLQYPITLEGWEKVRQILTMNNPHMTMIILLALTPINTDNTYAVKVTTK